MNILVTAIGSMSAECVITQLNKSGNLVVGCDIYPKDWHYESMLCDYFYQSPYADDEEKYCNFLINTCKKHDIKYIVPLTDLEIDVINRNRNQFAGITLCMPEDDVLKIIRNKYELYKYFERDDMVTVPTTWKLLDYKIRYNTVVAKLINGRSSQGLLIKPEFEQLMVLDNPYKYIVQQYVKGNVCTVDYCRSAKDNKDSMVMREELIRTSNGAGLTVKMFDDKKLASIVSYIGNKLNINGSLCMEFIHNGDNYYLIDINSRFSAGVAFSLTAGYDMIGNHINCFNNLPIDEQISVTEQILIKRYTL